MLQSAIDSGFIYTLIISLCVFSHVLQYNNDPWVYHKSLTALLVRVLSDVVYYCFPVYFVVSLARYFERLNKRLEELESRFSSQEPVKNVPENTCDTHSC